MARRKAICFCCPPEKQQTLQPVDGHHVVPVEYGGQESGKKVDICPSCHDLIHNVAEQVVDNGEIPPNLTNNQRILVQYIVRAKLDHIDSGKEKSDTARNQVQFRLTNQELAAVHSIKKEKGFKSLERYIKDLIFDDIKRHQKATRR